LHFFVLLILLQIIIHSLFLSTLIVTTLAHMKKCLFLILVFGTQLLAQENIPKDYFDNPLKIPLILSGSFGELRSNHFHSGLDLKTQQKEGIPIYAPADGWVKRIKVSHYGYGKALYIAHPNGYNTVYAHLQKYAGAIESYVKNKQYKKESYTIELFPSATILPVKKGDIIGYTGNSGSSGGPHLHFEIRDSSSRPMNPMLFGIEIPDTKTPVINTLFAYPQGESSHINHSKEKIKLRLIKQKDGSFRTEEVLAYGKVGFGIATHDQQNGASNKNGVYQISTQNNGFENYKVCFDKFSFSETRYLNRMIDYEHFKKNKSRVQKLFRQRNNPLSIIKDDNNGYLTIEDGLSFMYTITASDFKGNKISITIPIKGAKEEATQTIISTPESSEYVNASQSFSITKGRHRIYIPAHGLYENENLNIITSGDTIHLHKDVIPLHKNMTLSIDVSNYNEKDIESLYIGKVRHKGPPSYHKTYRKGKRLSIKTKIFGSYVLARDTQKPIITPINFSDGKWISKNKTLTIKIEDAISGISAYRATINGKFILTEYDYKKDVLVYDFDDKINNESENKLKLVVTDNVGNSTTFEATFFRKQL